MPENVEWNFILDKIKKEKCVLLLGPELCTTENGKSFEELMVEQITPDSSDKRISYYKKDGFFLFRNEEEKMHFGFQMEQLYKTACNQEVFKTIAELPFHLIISATPDLNLNKVFHENNIPHDFAFYDKTNNPSEIDEPSKDKPLIYNLLGNVEKWDSLILTYEDLFDFLSKIMGDRELPINLRNTLKQADSLIFLGFIFEKWYVQLLLRILQLQMGKTKYAYNKAIDYETQCFCIEQFKIKFIDENMHQFLKDLHEKCESEGILRKSSNEDMPISGLLEKYLTDDLLEKAIAIAKDFFQKKNEEELSDDIILLEGRQKRLMRKINLGVLEDRLAEIEHNKIKIALMELNKEIKLMES